MSGRYAYIGRDYEDDHYTGTTHGCGCCSNREALKAEDIVAHIAALEDALAKAREALRFTNDMDEAKQRVKNMMEGK